MMNVWLARFCCNGSCVLTLGMNRKMGKWVLFPFLFQRPLFSPSQERPSAFFWVPICATIPCVICPWLQSARYAYLLKEKKIDFGTQQKKEKCFISNILKNTGNFEGRSYARGKHLCVKYVKIRWKIKIVLIMRSWPLKPSSSFEFFIFLSRKVLLLY